MYIKEDSELDDISEEITTLAEQQGNLFTLKPTPEAFTMKTTSSLSLLKSNKRSSITSSPDLTSTCSSRDAISIYDASSDRKRTGGCNYYEVGNHKKSKEEEVNLLSELTKEPALGGTGCCPRRPELVVTSNNAKITKASGIQGDFKVHRLQNRIDEASHIVKMMPTEQSSEDDTRSFVFPMPVSLPDKRCDPKKSYIPGPAGKLPIITPEERRELFRRELEMEQNYKHRIQVDLQKLHSAPTSRSQIVKQLSIPKDDGMAEFRLSTDSVAWVNMLNVHPEYGDCKYNCIDTPKLKGGCIKIPTIMVYVDRLRKMERGAGAVFKHYYGEIRGGIDKSVLEFFGQNITQGAVLHLQEVSVFRPTIGSIFLNITLKNVVSLFPAKGVPPCINNSIVNLTSSTTFDTPHNNSTVDESPDEYNTNPSEKPSSDQIDLFDAMQFDIPTEEDLEKILASDQFNTTNCS